MNSSEFRGTRFEEDTTDQQVLRATNRKQACDRRTTSAPFCGPPSQPALVLGLDGCRGGWVWCGRIEGRWRSGLAGRLIELLPVLGRAAPALIDMPIGLGDAGAAQRACDREARSLLGRPRASSVFRPPCRAALAAADYAEACAINRRNSGTALSLQIWNIMPKIAEVDALLQDRPALRGRLREAHPEVCLHGLAGGRTMRHNKRSAAGRAERRALLTHLSPDALQSAESLIRTTSRREVAVDDAIDAAALAVTAALAADGKARTLPERPEQDACGLPMEMVYARP